MAGPVELVQATHLRGGALRSSPGLPSARAETLTVLQRGGAFSSQGCGY